MTGFELSAYFGFPLVAAGLLWLGAAFARPQPVRAPVRVKARR